jgi:hypothetical protein
LKCILDFYAGFASCSWSWSRKIVCAFITKKGPIGHDHTVEVRVEDSGNRGNDAIKEFVRLFKVVTGNEFEPWEREKRFEKKGMKMYPLDMVLVFC